MKSLAGLLNSALQKEFLCCRFMTGSLCKMKAKNFLGTLWTKCGSTGSVLELGSPDEFSGRNAEVRCVCVDSRSGSRKQPFIWALISRMLRSTQRQKRAHCAHRWFVQHLTRWAESGRSLRVRAEFVRFDQCRRSKALFSNVPIFLWVSLSERAGTPRALWLRAKGHSVPD